MGHRLSALPTLSALPARGAISVTARAADGVPLAGVHVPASPEAVAFVLAHGFTNDTGRPSTQTVIGQLARHGAVVALDFRGHGNSGGRSSVGRDEVLDLDAAVRLARDAGHQRVAVVGFSMGGAVALRQAAIGDDLPDAVVAVSAPSRWYIRESAPMRRVHWLLESPLGPRVGRFVGVRLGTPWPTVPPTPLELVADIAPIPLLIVHGTADRYFNPAHALALHRASGAAGPLWIENGMGHAESGAPTELLDRLAGWVISVAGPAS